MSFDDAFRQLTAYLTKEVQSDETISFPPEILEPFHHLTNPTNPKLLRPLLKVFDGKGKSTALRLVPNSLYALFAIVLEFPHSWVQEKLIHGFLNVILSLRNEKAIAEELSLSTGRAISQTAVQAGREYVCRKIAQRALAILQNLRNKSNARQQAAYILVRLLIADKATTPSLDGEIDDCVCHTICNGSNYVLRLLTAEFTRYLIHQSPIYLEKIFKEAPKQLREPNLWSRNTTSAWLGQISDVLGQISPVNLSDLESDRIFRLQRVEFEDGIFEDQAGNIIAVVSDKITFVVPTQPDDTLSLIEVSLTADSTVSYMHADESHSNAPKHNLVNVKYSAENGERRFQGVRKAISSFLLMLAIDTDGDKFLQTIRKSSTASESDDVGHSSPTQYDPQPPARRQLLMFTTMDLASEYDSWAPGNDSSPHEQQIGHTKSASPDLNTRTSPVLVQNSAETEEMCGSALFGSTMNHGQGTNLYGQLKASQKQDSIVQQQAGRTPHMFDTEERSNNLDQNEQESPTLRLSQAALVEAGTVKVVDMKGSSTRRPRNATNDRSLTKANEQHRVTMSEHAKSSEYRPSKLSILGKESIHSKLSENTTTLGIPQTLSRNAQQGSKRIKKVDNSWNEDVRIGNMEDVNVSLDQKLRPTVKGQATGASAATQAPRRSSQRLKGNKDNAPAKQENTRGKLAIAHLSLIEHTEDGNLRVEELEETKTGNEIHKHSLKMVSTIDRSTKKDVTQKIMPMHKGRSQQRPISVSSASLSGSGEESTGEDSMQPMDAQFGSRRSRSIVEQPASPPKPMPQYESPEPDDGEGNKDTVAEDSYPVNQDCPPVTTSADASFAQKLSQMIATKATSKSSTARPPNTPFGNTKRFVADINAAKEVSPSKLSSKSQGNRAADPKQSHQKRKRGIVIKQQETVADNLYDQQVHAAPFDTFREVVPTLPTHEDKEVSDKHDSTLLSKVVNGNVAHRKHKSARPDVIDQISDAETSFPIPKIVHKEQSAIVKEIAGLRDTDPGHLQLSTTKDVSCFIAQDKARQQQKAARIGKDNNSVHSVRGHDNVTQNLTSNSPIHPAVANTGKPSDQLQKDGLRSNNTASTRSLTNAITIKTPAISQPRSTSRRKMLPPPRPVLPLKPRARTMERNGREVRQNTSGPVKNLLRDDSSNENTVPAKRIKANHDFPTEDKDIPPEGTPVSFGARIRKDMEDMEQCESRKTLEPQDTTNVSAGNETTMVNTTLGTNSEFYKKQAKPEGTPELTDDFSSSEIEFEGTPASQHANDQSLKPERHVEMRRTLHTLVEKLISPFTQEEDAIQARLRLYDRRSSVLMARFQNSWVDKIEHQKETSLKALNQKKQILMDSAATLNANEAILKQEKLAVSEQVEEAITKRKDHLLSVLEIVPT